MAARKNTNRSRAAKKAWQTRRANERKRSAAARKGWRTRKAKQPKPVKKKKRAKRDPFFDDLYDWFDSDLEKDEEEVDTP